MNIFEQKAPLADLAILARHLAVMLKSGMSVTEAIHVAGGSARGGLKRVLAHVARAVESGRTLEQALAEHPRVFSPHIVSAVRAGESSGTLVENLEHLAVSLEKERELKAKVMGAMLYPLIILIAASGLAVLIAIFILPKITPIFRGLRVTLPASTRALLWLTDIVDAHGAVIATGLAVGLIAVSILVTRKFMRPVTGALALWIPVVRRVVVSSHIARFSRTSAMLLKSGLTLDEALAVTETNATNVYYQRAIRSARERARGGETLSAALADHASLFPPLVTNMIRVGENAGAYESTLTYLAEFYESDVDTATKSLASLVEPLLLLVMGGVVVFLALSIISPIYEITGSLRR
ncbi:MAG: type II secretion system F family protein [Patescibacteria group bacterium]